MLDWLLVTVATVVAVEVFLRTPFKRLLKALSHAAVKSRKTLASKFISDHWKEAVLPRYAFSIFKNSVLLFGCLVITVLPVLLIDLAGKPFAAHTLGTLATGWGIVFSLLIATLYVFLRVQLLNTDEYSPLQKLLHFLALSSTSVAEASFDTEMRSGGFSTTSSTNEKHIFVSGLARAGTTILMRSIYGTEQFSSLTYADMPFVLAPNLWGKVSGKNTAPATLKERAHADGILVSHQSPEALDEVFWRVFANDDYVSPDYIRAHKASPEALHKYKQYISAITYKYKKPRYLSKNNNNILRLESLHDAFPDARIVIPFRDPLQHAYSLLKQHQFFLEKQRDDKFITHYMSWLGHYEFGQTHKRFSPEGRDSNHQDMNTIDYWLEQWRTVYQFLAKHPVSQSDSVIFVSYERLCGQSEKVWARLCDKLDLGEIATPALHASVTKTPEPTDQQLLAEATAIYAQLDQRCRDTLNL